MTKERTDWIIQIALSSLEQWYVTWDLFKRYGDAEVRRRALAAKTYGLVWHDRHLKRGIEVFSD
ncbi:hypothetical protein LOY33_13080 [Pseudomonas sp. B21-036]|uniref:hypothetical protein n=1 Tax=unclassified Pseudomonas TaxID=196821 RepID=UPI0021609C5A|nr:hypothetical protein [Pseudomonas sp. B21-036]UVL48934.1 hypothetical protein LOY33_13080 [Pseudomonas sp. B21-036]